MSLKLSRNRGRSSLGFVVAVLAAVVLSPVAWPGDIGRCISAPVPDPVVLPDGTVHPAGQIRICLTRAFSPVAGLHATYVNEKAVGMFISRTGQGETGGEVESPFFVFRRNPRGELVLEGYADPAGNRLNTYLVRAPDRGRYNVISHWRTARRMGETDRQDENVILLAAARR